MRRCARLIMVVGALLGVGRAGAHPPPAARARLEFAEENRYRLTITCDVAALVMQAPQGHLGEARARDVREMPARELERWADDAQRALRQNLYLTVAGEHCHPSDVELPPLDRLRRCAKAHLDDGFETVVVCGELPAGTRSFRITFPADLGKVELTVWPAGVGPVLVSLGPAETSRPLPTAGPRDDGWEEPSARRVPPGAARRGPVSRRVVSAEPALVAVVLAGMYVLLGLGHTLRRWHFRPVRLP